MLVIAVLVLVVCVIASLSLGSKAIPLQRVWAVLFSPDGSADSLVVHDLRMPRTVIAIAVGAALALAGVIMQTVTRNPLADPGILGVTAGASLAVVLAVALTGLIGITSYVWFALLGAAVATVGVWLLGGAGRAAAAPLRLTLAGVAASAALLVITQAVILADQQAFEEFRFWVAGSLEGRGWAELTAVAPFLVAGAVIALLLAPALNALVLGEESGRALGVAVPRTRLLALAAICLLCGGATAAVGPIAFVGLAVPLIVRALVGHDLRWILGVSLILGPASLLAADTIARVVVAPQEIQAGIVCALIGGPLFVAIVHRRGVPAL